MSGEPLSKADQGTRDASSVSNMIEEFSNAFAKAFAVFSAELAAQFQKRGLRLDTAPPHVGLRPLPSELADAPDWVKESYAKALVPGPAALPDPEGVRAKYIAQRLRLNMKIQSVNQAALAKRLKMAPSQLSRILKSPERSQLSTLTRIANELGVEISDVLRGPSSAE